MIKTFLQPLRALRNYMELPTVARAACRRDRRGLPEEDPGCRKVIDEGLGWLSRAQDNSLSHDGGVARDYSLLKGWSSSYPETTGYIIPTMLELAKLTNDSTVRRRAKRMLDWLVAIQFPEGGFQGGRIDETPKVPVTFNTGQILIGLAAAKSEFGDKYFGPMCRAAQWLVDTQDSDGCWRSQPTPFAKPGEKAYETHVAWGLFEAARIAPGKGFAEAGMANIRWALTNQRDNGWFEKCCLKDPSAPLTHTLGYVLRGIIEAYRYSEDKELLDRAIITADGLLTAIRLSDGFIPGRLTADWRGAVNSACLTGSAQIAHCWLMLYQYTGDERYLNAAYAANRFVRRTIQVAGPDETRGGVKGSFPVDGDYGKFEYLNWACKFTIDSNLLELNVRGGGSR